METLYEGRVEPADIDNLGHMNVRVYSRKAALATHELAARLGMDGTFLTDSGSVIHLLDSHIHFRREQLEGAPLAVKGGVLNADEREVTAYLELSNTDSGDLAATFTNTFQLCDAPTRNVGAIPTDAVSAASGLMVTRPDHANPRSLPIAPLRTDFTLARMMEANVHQRIDDYSVDADDCDTHGFMDLSNGVHLPFAKMPIKFARQGKGVSKEEEHDNAKWSDMSVAIVTMESRQHIFATPRLGDTVHTRSIHAHVGEKSLTFNHWVFNKETGEPYALLAQFGLGFDLDARKTIPFPDDMRANLEQHMYPEFSDILA